MPTCSQAKILTNLETGIQKRANLRPPNTNEHENFVHQNEVEQENFYQLNNSKSHHRKFSEPLESTRSTRIYNQNNKQRTGRRISVDELSTNQFEPTLKKILHKVPIVFNENLKKVPSFLYNCNYNRVNQPPPPNNNSNNNSKPNSLRVNKHAVGSDGEEHDLSGSSLDEYTSEKSSGDWLYNNLQQKRPTYRRSIDFGQLKKISAEDCKMYTATRNQEIQRRNSLLNQNQNVLSTHFPKIALEIESCVDGDEASLGLNSGSVNKQRWLGSSNNLRQDLNPKLQSLNAKRLLALASIRPSVTFHKSMTAEEIQVLKKYYEILKPKIHIQHVEEKTEDLVPTLMYDTTKIKFLNLQNLKTFLITHKRAIEVGELVIDYDVNNDGAPSGFVLKRATGDCEVVTKFPAEINDAFFALTCINEVSDKVEANLGEANLFRVLNWNDTSALCDTMISKKHSTQSPKYFQTSSSNLHTHPHNTASLSSTSSSNSSSSSSSELSFEYIKNLSNLVCSVVPHKLSKQLKTNSIDISTLPGGAAQDIPTFEELGIHLPTLISSITTTTNTTQHGNNLATENNNQNLAPIEYQSQKLKVTAYKTLKEKVSSTKTMWFSGPPERKQMSVIFEYAGDEFGHEKILEEVDKCLKGCSNNGRAVCLEFVPRSVQLGSVYVENQWILTLDCQKTKFFCITNGLRLGGDGVEVQSYDEFIFNEFERFIRVEKYKHLIKNHEKAVLSNQKKYAAK